MSSHPLWRPLDAGANAERQAYRIAHRQVTPGPLEPHRDPWHDDFVVLSGLVRGALGDHAIEVSHVGSTAVPDLVAKPVIDIDLVVPDVDDESAYRPALETAGFRLVFADPVGPDSHRQFTFAEPNCNLHVWSPGAVEPQRHRLFVAWLSEHAEERRRYEAAKRAAADPSASGRYNDRKAVVVHEIYQRALAADLARRGDDQVSR